MGIFSTKPLPDNGHSPLSARVRAASFRLFDSGLKVIADTIADFRETSASLYTGNYGRATHNITSILNTSKSENLGAFLTDVVSRLGDCSCASIYVKINTNGSSEKPHLEQYVTLNRNPKGEYVQTFNQSTLELTSPTDMRILYSRNMRGAFLDPQNSMMLDFSLDPKDHTFVPKTLPQSSTLQTVTIPLTFDGTETGLLVLSGTDLSLATSSRVITPETMKESLAYLADVSRMIALIFEKALDSLTKLQPRGVFDRELRKSITNYRTLGSTPDSRANFSLLLMDIDHFKRVNDELGHLAGDDVLRSVANLTTRAIRFERRDGERDLLSRYGGEELVALLPGCNLEDGVKIVDRIRRNIDSIPQLDSGQKVTLSFGLVDSNNAFADYVFSDDYLVAAKRMIKGADDGLYYIKHNGRNNLTLARANGAAANPFDYQLVYEQGS